MSISAFLSRFLVRALLALGLATAAASPAAAALQCVPYARAQSGIEIRGNAGTWWAQAEGRYNRGAEPRVGAVLVMRPSRAMPIGHVAVVAEIVDERTIYLNHANWSGPGRIERRALAVDVSENGDWSSVRVWYAPQGSLGLRTNATFGFIYNEAPGAPTAVTPRLTIASVVLADLPVRGTN
ncbi:MAG TPA: CHAP domain-containing protein [Allosphingosinicella sp.]|nr:CHAP domain-containing protein [Allosphingosinicella sp.]